MARRLAWAYGRCARLNTSTAESACGADWKPGGRSSTSMTSLLVSTTARSMTFSSSRTLPVHRLQVSASMARGLMPVTFLSALAA